MFSPVAESPRWLTLMIMLTVLTPRTDTAFSVSKGGPSRQGKRRGRLQN
jgi:hypothetical protein